MLLLPLSLGVNLPEADWLSIHQVQYRLAQLGSRAVVADVSYQVLDGVQCIFILFYAPVDGDAPGWVELVQPLEDEK